jgi:hypothetical protein
MLNFSAPYSKFLSSMQITVDEWRDGIGFDLESLRELKPAERDAVPALVQRLAQYGESSAFFPAVWRRRSPCPD